MEPSPRFLQQVREQVERLPQRPRPPWFRRLAGALPLQIAATVAVVVSATLVWQMQPHIQQGHVQEVQPASQSEPWLSHERGVVPMLDTLPFEPALEEILPIPTPLVQAAPRWSGWLGHEEVIRVGHERPAIPRHSRLPAAGWSSAIAYSPSLTLQAADPAHAAQQIWELVPRIGGELLQSQGMITPADRASRGVVRLAFVILPERYPTLLERLRQLSGTTLVEERLAVVSRELPQASSPFLQRVEHTPVVDSPQLILVTTILRR
jgi:hypothetical protein